MRRGSLTLFALFFLILAFTINKGYSQGLTEEQIKHSMKEMLGANNVGKEFWFANPPAYEETAGNNFVKVFVTTAIKTLVYLEVPGKGVFETKMSIPNDIIVFDLPPAIGQPYSKPTREEPRPEQIYEGYGVHIYADDPLVVYCVVRFQATSDGYLAVPVSALGKEYIVAAYNDDPMFRAVWNIKLPSTTCIVAPYDKTKVSFTLGGNEFTETAGGMKPGQTKFATLNRGDVWMFMSTNDNGDLTGSKIVADKPIAVVSGNQCTNIPIGNQWCDYTVEMQLPTSVWGKHYHVPQVPGRKYPSIIRVFAKEPETSIFRNGKKVSYIKTAGGVEGRGFQEMRIGPQVDGVKPKSAVYSGDKPIGITLYNCGVQEDGYPLPNSDPFTMVITPMEQYQTEITFCTPSTFGGAKFAENYLNLVYETDEFGMVPSDMMYAQVYGGDFDWVPLRQKHPEPGEIFEYDVDGRKFGKKTITLPTVGVFKIKGSKPFAAYSFGYDWCDSYGYPTSAALADLEKPDTVCPLPLWTIDCYGNVLGATVTDRPSDDNVRSNLAKIIFHRELSYNYDFKHDDFIPGNDWKTGWEARVINPEEDARAVISFSDRRGNDTTITIEYFAVKVEIEPDNWDYGKLMVGTEAIHDFKLISKSKGFVRITKIEFKRNDQNFEFLGLPSFPYDLKPNEELPFQIKFKAVKIGDEYWDSVRVADTCFWWSKSYVKAEVQAPAILVDDYDFGPQPIGSLTKQQFNVRNTGTFTLTITGIKGPANTNVYKVEKLDVFPIILEPNATYQFTVGFIPDAEKTYPDVIEFISNAVGGDNLCILNGSGIQAKFWANNYDWGYRRIDRPQFPMGPYPVEPGDPRVIEFKNDGNVDLKITKATFNVKSGDAAAFNVTPETFRNLVVPAKSSVFVDVTFQPKQTGPYELEIIYENDANLPGSSTLKGIGILGELQTQNMDFGKTLVDELTNPQTRTIRITNISQRDDAAKKFGDAVTITKLNILPNANSISTNGTWLKSSEGFYFDISKLRHSKLGPISLPVTLQMGEYIEIDATFIATHTGTHSASVKTTSDALTDVQSDWSGEGEAQAIEMKGSEVVVCAGEVGTLTAEINNSGSGDIEVTSVRLEPDLPEFSFANEADKGPFTIPMGEKKTIAFNFISNVEFPKRNVSVIAETKALEFPEIQTVISAEAKHFDRSTSNRVSQKELTIGDIFAYTINLDNGEDISLAKVNELAISISYKKDFITYLPGTHRLGNDIKDAVSPIISISYDKVTNTETISITLRSLGSYIFNEGTELISLNFRAFLPYTSVESKEFIFNSKTTLSYNITARGNLCVDLTGSSDSVVLNPTCVTDLRTVFIGQTTAELFDVNPNPVDSRGAEIKFSVPFDNSSTSIEILNSGGSVVAVPLSSTLNSGVYILPLPIDKLTSGMYLIRMTTGGITRQSSIVVTK